MIQRALTPITAYLRYVIASGLALGVDLALFFALYEARVAPTLATAIGYSAGIVAHWLVSSRFVFVEGSALSGRARHVQKVMFVLTAFVGLVLSVAVVAAGQLIAIDARIAKLVAVVVSFQSGWLLRRGLVFA